jgi:hypothetical protein
VLVCPRGSFLKGFENRNSWCKYEIYAFCILCSSADREFSLCLKDCHDYEEHLYFYALTVSTSIYDIPTSQYCGLKYDVNRSRLPYLWTEVDQTEMKEKEWQEENLIKCSNNEDGNSEESHDEDGNSEESQFFHSMLSLPNLLFMAIAVSTILVLLLAVVVLAVKLKRATSLAKHHSNSVNASSPFLSPKLCTYVCMYINKNSNLRNSIGNSPSP